MSSIVVAGDTSGSITISAPAVSGSNTLSLPAVTDTLAGIAATQTLTNKTLTSPVMTAPTLGTVASGNISACTATSLAVSGFVGTSATGALTLPVGTTAERPGTPTNGMLRFNTTLDYTEEYRAGQWVGISNTFAAEGGTITTSGGFKYHTFLSSGTFTITSGSASLNCLIVAGGGGGGAWVGSGGGAGGYISLSPLGIVGSYPIVIGAGGAGEVNPGGYAGMPVVRKGFDTTALGSTALGGGAGRSHDIAGINSNGGSGGGAVQVAGSGMPANTPGSGTTGQGNRGGFSDNIAGDPYANGGGGGASTVGGNGGSAIAGSGGTGATWLNGVTYAGGGGGGCHGAGTGGAAGSGGGGFGRAQTSTPAGSGAINTGGGGGGAGNNGGSSSYGGAGGSGIVIIRYAI